MSNQEYSQERSNRRPTKWDDAGTLNSNRLNARMMSFKYATIGVKILLKEPNARIQVIVAIALVVTGSIRGLDGVHWALLFLAMGLVLVAESMNTAIEYLSDHVCGDKWEEEIGKVKDVAAGGVLIAAIASIFIGIFVFLF
jgi:diacylglycerol kinase